MDPSGKPSARWLLPGVMLMALVVRGGAALALFGQLAEDPDAYRQIAEIVATHGIYGRVPPLEREAPPVPTAHRPPLYPLLLAALAPGGKVWLPGVAVLQVALGLVTVLIVYRLGERWRLGSGAAVAALLVACDPILLQQASLVMTETLATLLGVIGLWQLTLYGEKPTLAKAALAGAILGLATLCRPTFLPWLGLAALGAILLRQPWRLRLTQAAVTVVAAFLVLAPWAMRNVAVLGTPKLTTTHGGYTLWLGNNPEFYDWLTSDKMYAWPGPSELDPAVRVYREAQQAGEPITPELELAADVACYRAAIASMQAQPAQAMYGVLARIGWLWSPLPQKTAASESTYRTLARFGIALWYVGVYLLAAAGAWRLARQRATAWLWGLALCLAVTAVHAAYWSNLRMRAPLMPVVALMAGAGLYRSAERKTALKNGIS